ncbi:hypothetical protein FRB94_003124 [Tulasnella sp. JGI-2019a]|nr:hypothetical protein FRB94_003124 [Tulasnella sp. JGI-2019a]
MPLKNALRQLNLGQHSPPASPPSESYRLLLAGEVREAFTNANVNAASSVLNLRPIKELIEQAVQLISSLDAAALLVLKKYFESTKQFCTTEVANIVTFFRVVAYMRQINGSYARPTERGQRTRSPHVGRR